MSGVVDYAGEGTCIQLELRALRMAVKNIAALDCEEDMFSFGVRLYVGWECVVMETSSSMCTIWVMSKGVQRFEIAVPSGGLSVYSCVT